MEKPRTSPENIPFQRSNENVSVIRDDLSWLSRKGLVGKKAVDVMQDMGAATKRRAEFLVNMRSRGFDAETAVRVLEHLKTIESKRNLVFDFHSTSLRDAAVLTHHQVNFSRDQKIGYMQKNAGNAISEIHEVNICALVSLITGKKIPADDPAYKEISAKILAALETADPRYPKKMDELARNLLSQFGPADKKQAVTPAKLSLFLMDYSRGKEAQSNLQMVVGDNAFIDAYLKEVKTGNEDSQAVFQKALRSASPEVRERFNAYLERWRAMDRANANQQSLPGRSADLTSMPSQSAVSEIETSGAVFRHFAGGQCEIQFGMTARPAHLRSLENGKVALFIEDKEADRGVRGPLDPSQAADEMWKIKIDDYVSRKFREFLPRTEEKDAAQIPDVQLDKMARALFPRIFEAHGEELEPAQKSLLDNFAALLAEPDPKYLFVGDKLKFLEERVLGQKDRLEIVRKMLGERTSRSGRNYSISGLEQKLGI